MTVDGKTIPNEAVDAGLTAMNGRFSSRDVEMAMRRAGCGEEAYRAADRLMQRERKAGRIRVGTRVAGCVAWECCA